MPLAELVGDRIEVATDFIDKDLIRQVPGAKFDPQRKLWYTTVSWGSYQTLGGVFGPKLVIGEKLNEWAFHDYSTRVQQANAWRELLECSFDAETYGLDPQLMKHQVVDVFWAGIIAHGLLGNEMGTGKSASLASAMRYLELIGLDPYPVCIICPNSVKGPWRDEWDRWVPEANVFLIAGSAAVRKKLLTEAAETERAVVILNWEAARLHSRLAPYGSIKLKRCQEHGGDEIVKPSACEVHAKELNLLGFHTVIADEVHKMKDPKSKQTRALWAIQHGDTVTRRYGLTGTPLANHPGDLWSIMHGLAPDDYPSKTRYVDRYALLAWNTFGGMDIVGVRPDTRSEFFSIFDPHFRRVLKAMVLDLPPKLRPTRFAEMTTKQAKAYGEIEKGSVTRLDDGRLVLATSSLAQATRLLQFSSSYAEVDAETGKVVLTEPCPKVDALVDVLDELGDKPVVACAESRQLIMIAAARLEKLGISYRLIVGGMTNDQRDASLRDFQNGDARVMLFTIKAGGTGLTMTAADTIVFLQRSWSMLENKQAEDRVHRIGAEKHESISIIDVIAPGTIEEHQVQRLRVKMERLEEIVRDKARLASAGMTADVARLEAEESIILSDNLGGVILTPETEVEDA